MRRRNCLLWRWHIACILKLQGSRSGPLGAHPGNTMRAAGKRGNRTRKGAQEIRVPQRSLSFCTRDLRLRPSRTLLDHRSSIARKDWSCGRSLALVALRSAEPLRRIDLTCGFRSEPPLSGGYVTPQKIKRGGRGLRHWPRRCPCNIRLLHFLSR